MVATSPALRLVTDTHLLDDDAPLVAGRIGFEAVRPPLRLAGIDRRLHPRQTISLRVRGRRLDAGEAVRDEPFLNLNLADVSMGGLQAHSQTRLRVGERVTIFFPPHGNDRGRGWDAYGRVVRVQADAHQPGCRVAICFDAGASPAAA